MVYMGLARIDGPITLDWNEDGGVTQAAIVRGIKSQMCPWCGQGPFIVLAGHVWQAHGLNRKQLRRAAGIVNLHESICALDHTTRLRKKAAMPQAQKRFKEAMVGLDRSAIAQSRDRFSVEKQTERALRMHEANMEERKRIGETAYRGHFRGMADKRIKVPRADHASIATLHATGVYVNELAGKYGVSGSLIRKIIRGQGYKVQSRPRARFICEYCAKVYPAGRLKQRFCSKSCMMYARHQGAS